MFNDMDNPVVCTFRTLLRMKNVISHHTVVVRIKTSICKNPFVIDQHDRGCVCFCYNMIPFTSDALGSRYNIMLIDTTPLPVNKS